MKRTKGLRLVAVGAGILLAGELALVAVAAPTIARVSENGAEALSGKVRAAAGAARIITRVALDLATGIACQTVGGRVFALRATEMLEARIAHRVESKLRTHQVQRVRARVTNAIRTVGGCSKSQPSSAAVVPAAIVPAAIVLPAALIDDAGLSSCDHPCPDGIREKEEAAGAAARSVAAPAATPVTPTAAATGHRGRGSASRVLLLGQPL